MESGGARSRPKVGNRLDAGNGTLTQRPRVATFARMRSVALTTLRDRLDEYIRLAQAGETVLVTDDERVVAEIVPPQPERAATSGEDDFIARGVREGWLTPATDRSKGPPPRKPVMKFDDLIEGSRKVPSGP